MIPDPWLLATQSQQLFKFLFYYAISIYFFKGQCLPFFPASPPGTIILISATTLCQYFIYFIYYISPAPQNTMLEIWCSVHGKYSFVELLMWCQTMLWRHYIVDLWYHTPWQCLLRSRHSHWLRACCSYCQCSWKRHVPGVCYNLVAKRHTVPVV